MAAGDLAREGPQTMIPSSKRAARAAAVQRARESADGEIRRLTCQLEVARSQIKALEKELANIREPLTDEVHQR
eukprot:9472066-Pyramimonas_sp.AAC.1